MLVKHVFSLDSLLASFSMQKHKLTKPMQQLMEKIKSPGLAVHQVLDIGFAELVQLAPRHLSEGSAELACWGA